MTDAPADISPVVSAGWRGAVATRIRAYGQPPRIVGVDVARGLAVLGMFGAHVGVTEAFDWSQPATWLDVVNGRSSILFAVLAGVSIAIIAGGFRPVSGTDLLRARIRIFTRAVIIFALGGLLEFLGTAVAVILPVYAVLFVLALPFLRWRPRRLFLLAGVLAIVSPVLHLLLQPLFSVAGESAAGDLLIGGHYPAMIWIVFVLVGIGVGRLDLTSGRVRWRLVAAGVLLAVIGYGAGTFAAQAVGVSPGQDGGASAAAFAWDDSPIVDSAAADADFSPLATTAPHSGSPFEVIGSTGVALLILGVSLLVPRRLRWPLYPVAAVGAMALTAYSVHIFAIALIGPDATAGGFPWLFLTFVLVALVGCSVWTLLVGRGPLERFLTTISSRAAGKGASRLRR